jgi:hypothetical protein
MNMNKLIAYYDNTKEDELNYDLHIFELLDLLTKKVRFFCFQEFFDLVSHCDNNSEELKE